MTNRGIVERAGPLLAILCWLGGTSDAGAQNPPEQWSFSLGAREAHEISRVTNGVEQPGRIADNFNSTLGFSSTGPKSTFNLFGRVGANVYREGEDRKRYTYGGGFGWSRSGSERFQTHVSASISKGIRLETQSNLGILSPNLDATSGNARWQSTYRASPRTTISTSLGYSGTHLQNDQPIEGSQIVLDTAPFSDEFQRPFEQQTGPAPLELPDSETNVLDILATEGLFSRNTSAHTAMASASLSHLFSERSRMGLDVNGGYRKIDYRGSQLSREGAQGALRLWAGHRVGATNELGAAYQLTRSLAIIPNSTVQTVNGGLTHTNDRRNITYHLFAGVSLFQTDVTDSRISPVADASISAGITRSTRLGAQFRRQYSLSSGFGRSLLIDYGNVSVNQGFGTRVDLTLIAGVSLATDPLQDDLSHDARRFGGYLTYRLLESLRVGTSFFQMETERVNRGLSQDTRRKLWSIFITFSTQFE